MPLNEELLSSDILSYLQTHENKGLLRVLTCGSVDDGKSTLIGRLLYDSKLIYEDQLVDLQKYNDFQGVQSAEFDYSRLVDGLESEREQGITIDVAYRYFSTNKRKFIVADTPGHEQYTRNMVTGASTSDVAILLVDARHGVKVQTRRHSYVLSMLGVKHVVLAVNKMDVVDFSQKKFNEIEENFREFSTDLGFETIHCIPISALHGDNIISRSERMKWYNGPNLLRHIEGISVVPSNEKENFRFPVQWVNRPHQNFRGYSGTIVAGQIKQGDKITVMPSGKTSVIKDIVTIDGQLNRAQKHQSVTLTIEDDIDISRGDLICSSENVAQYSDQFQAKIIWMSTQKLFPGRSYLLKINNTTTSVSITNLKHKININDFSHASANVLELNEIGICNLSLAQQVAFDPFDICKSTGSFILIDRQTNDTVGAGMLNFSLRRAANLTWQNLAVGKLERAEQKHQKPVVLWFTGLSGAGKSTIASLVEKKLFDLGRHTYTLDGDNVRHGLNKDLGFTDADRIENIRRIGEAAKLMVDAGLMVLVSFISPFKAERQMARRLMEEGEFLEIYVNTPLSVVEKRDVKGLYAKARKGEIKNFTGIDSEYQVPENAEIIVETTTQTAKQAAEKIVKYLEKNGYLNT